MNEKPSSLLPILRKHSITVPRVKNSPNARLFQEKEGFRTRKHKEEEQRREDEEREKQELKKASEPDLFKTLKRRRQEEENCLDFLDLNRKELRSKNSKSIEDYLNEEFRSHLYKRIRLHAGGEDELKAALKKNFENKREIIDNRGKRNEQYIDERKKDFAISQRRVKLLVDKLRQEYNEAVVNTLQLCSEYRDMTEQNTLKLLENEGANTAKLIVDSAIGLLEIKDALSFVPFYYGDVVTHFHMNGLIFDFRAQEIRDFLVGLYQSPLLQDTSRVMMTILESFQPNLITPKLVFRKGRAISILSKPLVFTREQKIQIASKIGWKFIFAEDFEKTVEDIFGLLSTTEDDYVIFDFPRTLAEMDSMYIKFNPHSTTQETSVLLPRQIPSAQQPFDCIIELDMDDQLIISDALAIKQNSQTQEIFDVRDFDVQDEKQATNIQPVKDHLFDINQYPTRSVTLKINFELISNHYSQLYRSIEMISRNISEELEQSLNNIVETIGAPPTPKYPSGIILPNLISQIDQISPEIRNYIISHWNYIETTYVNTINEVFQLINSTHSTMVEHLSNSRKEMHLFFSRPGNSQQRVVEFQQWYKTQVERGMRRIPKVKEECNLRLSSLRETLLQIELDRKYEEETKQKDLVNAPFRQSLFEIMSNAYTVLAQAEIDRWTSTRILLMDLNQIILKSDLVPPIPHRKLEQIDFKNDKKKQAKKPAKANTPAAKSRLDGKLPNFELQLHENIDPIKKFVTEVSCTYIPVTAPASTRDKKRPVKDKNPLSIHRISAIDEFQAAFRDDDAYLIGKLEKIDHMAQEEVSSIQNAFEAFVNDSSNWIQAHLEIRKSIADTAIAYMKQKVDEEQQINQFIVLDDEHCMIDYTQLLAPNEERPKIPSPFPEEIVHDSIEGNVENLLSKIYKFQNEVISP